MKNAIGISAAGGKNARKFTNRNAQRQAFHNALCKLAPHSPPSVLFFFGSVGTGKSRLLDQLILELKNEDPQAIFSCHNFAHIQDHRSVLHLLKGQLAEKNKKFTFPFFDLCLYVYDTKRGDEKNLPSKRPLLESIPILGKLIDFSDNVPLPYASLIPKLINLLDEGQALLRGQKSKNTKLLKALLHMDAHTLYEQLPVYFAHDMQNNMALSQKPVIFFLDSYERFVNEFSEKEIHSDKDEWLWGSDGIIPNIPGTLWVIAGRAELHPARKEQAKSPDLLPLQLEDFTEEFSIEFLKSEGIEDEALQKNLLRLTHGNPYILNFCMDRKEQLKKDAPLDIEQFGQELQSLVNKCLSGMNKEHEEIFYLLICLRTWHIDLVDDIANKILPLGANYLESLQNSSFFSPIHSNHQSIPEPIASLMMQSCPKASRKRIGKTLLEFFKERIDDAADTDTFAELLCYGIKGGRLLYQERDAFFDCFRETFAPRLKELIHRNAFIKAEEIFGLLPPEEQEDKLSALIRYYKALYASALHSYQARVSQGKTAAREILSGASFDPQADLTPENGQASPFADLAQKGPKKQPQRPGAAPLPKGAATAAPYGERQNQIEKAPLRAVIKKNPRKLPNTAAVKKKMPVAAATSAAPQKEPLHTAAQQEAPNPRAIGQTPLQNPTALKSKSVVMPCAIPQKQFEPAAFGAMVAENAAPLANALKNQAPERPKSGNAFAISADAFAPVSEFNESVQRAESERRQHSSFQKLSDPGLAADRQPGELRLDQVLIKKEALAEKEDAPALLNQASPSFGKEDRETRLLEIYMMEAQLEKAVRTFGQQAPATLQLMEKYALKLCTFEKYEAALEWMQHLYAYHNAHSSPMSEERTRIKSALAQILSALHRYEEALLHQDELLQQALMIFGAGSKEAIDALCEFAKTLLNLQPKDALSLLISAEESLLPQSNEQKALLIQVLDLQEMALLLLDQPQKAALISERVAKLSTNDSAS